MSEKKEDNPFAGRPVKCWNDLPAPIQESLNRFMKLGMSQPTAPAPPQASVLDALENGKIGELAAICNRRDHAVNSLRATIDASRMANPFADTAPLYRAVIQRYQEFLNQIAALGDSAQDLQSRGFPALGQMLAAQKSDVEGAVKKVQEILGDNAAAWKGMNQIAQDTNKQILDSMLKMNLDWKKTFSGGSGDS